MKRSGLIVHRESAALPAAGALATSHGSILLSPDTRSLAVLVTYTLDGSSTTGQPEIVPYWQFGSGADAQWRPDPSYGVETEGTGDITIPFKETIVELAIPANSSAKAYPPIVLTVPDGATAFQARPREAGDTAHPGTLAMWVVLLKGEG